MTSEAQRVAIQEALGYEWWRFKDGEGKPFHQLVRPGAGWPERQGGVRCARPEDYLSEARNCEDYPNDLNACADFEKDAGNEYWRILNDIVDRDNKRIVAFAVGKAAASQRCEAFVRWKNLWKD